MADETAALVEGMPAEEARKTASEPVDLVHLSRYTLGERELEGEVLELFCTQSLVYLERLRAAQTEKAWRDAAHSLKGSAQAVGAWRAAAAAERAEQLSAEPILDDALAQARAERIGEIESSLREAETYIAALLKDR
jgi:HPt (histidine-containing phosphotransfer) domain-containing protein